MSELFIKIHKGTGKLTKDHLCSTCRHGQTWIDCRGEHSICGAIPGFKEQPRGKVFEYSNYYNKALPSLDDLYQSAWTLRTEKDGRKIGFTPPDKDKMTPPIR